MAQGRPTKEFQDYLIESTGSQVSHREYLVSPATAFLKHSIEAKSAIDLCVRTLPKNQDGKFSKNTLDSIQHLSLSILPTLMGHFETYQRYLFAGIFDMTVHLDKYKIKGFFDKINKQNKSEITIDLERLAAYRNVGTSSIGLLIADCLKGWHNPEQVNTYFNAFHLDYCFFDKEDVKKLKVLWQIRHSIVHTGGTITLPDAQKVDELKDWGDKVIVFENKFIFEIVRKFHPLIKTGTDGLGSKFKAKLKPNLSHDIVNKVDKFFEVKSSVAVWLK